MEEMSDAVADAAARPDEGAADGQDQAAESSSRFKKVMDALDLVKQYEDKPWAVGWDVQVTEPVEFKGRKGVTQSYDIEKQLFSVELAACLNFPCTTIEANGANLVFCGGSVEALGSIRKHPWIGENSCVRPPAEPTTDALRRLDQARALFAPGSKFKGTIVIPGMAEHFLSAGVEDTCDENNPEYTLDVVSECVDELGRRSFLIHHAAYGDSQACHLVLENGTGREGCEIILTYSDGETFCEGTVEFEHDQAACSLQGRVMQLQQGEEGIYEKSTEVTHVFELSRLTTHEVEAGRCRLIDASRDRRLDELCLALKDCPTLQQFTPWRDVPWKDVVFRDVVRRCEEQCATLRRQSALCNELIFESKEAKDEQLKRLHKAGIRRDVCHKACDRVLAQLKMLISAAFRALREDVGQLQMEDLKAQLRLTKGYTQFDKALRGVEARLPLDLLQTWRVSKQTVDAIEETPCAVCYLPLWEDGQESAQLPCSHTFHFDCLSRWLHGHTTCPNCRREFADPESDNDTPELESGRFADGTTIIPGLDAE